MFSFFLRAYFSQSKSFGPSFPSSVSILIQLYLLIRFLAFFLSLFLNTSWIYRFLPRREIIRSFLSFFLSFFSFRYAALKFLSLFHIIHSFLDFLSSMTSFHSYASLGLYSDQKDRFARKAGVLLSTKSLAKDRRIAAGLPEAAIQNNLKICERVRIGERF